MTKSFSNNATPKYLGYVYQVLIAIEQCFQTKNNQTIYIECFGDVYDGNRSSEIKHHFEPSNLTDNSEDFWKTLKNLVTQDTSHINSFILHTTANIRTNSIFYGWNELSKENKYLKLKNHRPSDTIKLYYDAVVRAYPESDLLVILERFTIKSSQLNVKDKWKELKENKIFTLIKNEYREDALDWVYGYVNKQAINDRYNWHIKINDFNSAFQFALAKYTYDKTPFEYVAESEIDSDLNNFLFIIEMKNIKLRDSRIQRAISSYLRAGKTLLKFLSTKPSLSKILDTYDNSILEAIEIRKENLSENIEQEDLNTDKAVEIAKKLYSNCMELGLVSIPSVDYTEKYYQDGRIHHNVNEEKFFWRFCEDDLK